ncbi:hypothetical protein Taro_051231 [Colocasia esculenta]|uniref:Uncharacterized protein n=1 Tax=Colocasia esculenta TaxID=4460 RepID=A0A843XG55_COLES|nr:hypothetical protein [Colocasia esculenta]
MMTSMFCRGTIGWRSFGLSRSKPGFVVALGGFWRWSWGFCGGGAASQVPHGIHLTASSSARRLLPAVGLVSFDGDGGAYGYHGWIGERDLVAFVIKHIYYFQNVAEVIWSLYLLCVWTELISDIQVGAKESKGAGKSTLPLFLKEEELSGEELEEYVKKRYGQGSDGVMYDEDDKEGDDRKSSLLSTSDPTIWRVRCMVGHEQRLAFCLIQKYVSLNVRGFKLPLISIFTLEHIKGYVYIEADKQHDIFEACKGFCALYTSKISLVPTNEVPRLLSVQHKPNGISEGAWVRMKNGKYKGDLAQVMSFDAEDKKATVKLVPRIDFQALAKKFGGGISLKHAVIPAPRLISSRELEDFRPHIETRHDRQTGELFEILDGMMLKDGYLYKKVSILSLNCFGVQPSSAELMKFEPAKRDEPQLSDYISNLYGGRKRNSSQTLDGTLEDNGSSIKLHDLVLFGRKDFGVIIGMKCDSFQILKGGVKEPLVVTVQQREIKKSCIDKMFTAPDSHKKTICINDNIKVLAGPQKDRQGIVKHMYKGTLFVYDEDIQEDTGFFCVKCESCEVIKGQKSCHFGSKGSAECSSMPQSPTKCSEQRDFDMKRYGQGDGDQLFTIGQTLRIRVGPLKGHLCRVVRIYRSDVTVKLDSLVKLMTEDGQTVAFLGGCFIRKGLFRGEMTEEEKHFQQIAIGWT